MMRYLVEIEIESQKELRRLVDILRAVLRDNYDVDIRVKDSGI